MAEPREHDLRVRLVAAVEGGMSCRADAGRFDVGDATVIRLMQRYREAGSGTHSKMGGHRPRVLEDERDWTLGRIAEEPDITTTRGP